MEWLYKAAWIVPLVLIGWVVFTGMLTWLTFRVLWNRDLEEEIDEANASLAERTRNGCRQTSGVIPPISDNTPEMSLPIEPAEKPEDVWNEDFGGMG